MHGWAPLQFGSSSPGPRPRANRHLLPSPSKSSRRHRRKGPNTVAIFWVLGPALMFIGISFRLYSSLPEALFLSDDSLVARYAPTFHDSIRQLAEANQQIFEDAASRLGYGAVDWAAVASERLSAVAAMADGEVVLHTELRRSIRLSLLPHLSESSVAYVRSAAAAGCYGNFTRAEPYLVQVGEVACTAPAMDVTKGACPPDARVSSQGCPDDDPTCNCHGPLMSKGMVAWVGGGVAPYFFVYTGDELAEHWGHTHTVFAVVSDSASWEALDELRALPSALRDGGDDGMRGLVKPIAFRFSEE
jgi:hypothetical protein